MAKHGKDRRQFSSPDAFQQNTETRFAAAEPQRQAFRARHSYQEEG